MLKESSLCIRNQALGLFTAQPRLQVLVLQNRFEQVAHQTHLSAEYVRKLLVLVVETLVVLVRALNGLALAVLVRAGVRVELE